MTEAATWDDKVYFLIHQIEHFLDEHGEGIHTLDAIGVGVTGIVDVKQECILNIPNVASWDNQPVVQGLSEHLRCPVFLDEGGRTMAAAESLLGRAGRQSDFLVVQVGFGIVAGIMCNGKLVRGTSNVGGLLGHVTADDQAGRCLCGNYGCLENIITYPMLESLTVSGVVDSQLCTTRLLKMTSRLLTYALMPDVPSVSP